MNYRMLTTTLPAYLFTLVILTCSIISLLSSLTYAVEAGGDQIKRGAQLYDNWNKLTASKVDGNHPLYPGSGQKSGGSTWRCKECHGWDYIGKDGRYAKGSHFTGIKGLWDARDKGAEDLYTAIAGEQHAFAGKISETDLRALAAFVAEGQLDITSAIDPTGQGKGSVRNGKTEYVANCADCHGVDGNDLDFNSKKDGIQGVGWLANDNPQETLHKIRWGHPGSDMPSLLVDKDLNNQDAIDILTYAQTLK